MLLGLLALNRSRELVAWALYATTLIALRGRHVWSE
jgi:hypothetical protein